jgi:hypothetical protein
LGIYINFFHPTLPTNTKKSFQVLMINDYNHPINGTMRLILEDKHGHSLAHTETPFAMNALGETELNLSLTIPAPVSGPCILKAVATPAKQSKIPSTTSRRWVTLESSEK